MWAFSVAIHTLSRSGTAPWSHAAPTGPVPRALAGSRGRAETAEVPDVLSSGPPDAEREPYVPAWRPPRWLAALGTAVAVGLAGVVVVTQAGPPAGAGGAARPSSPVTPGPLDTTPPVIPAGPEPEPALDGTPGPAPARLRLVVDGERVVVVSGSSARVTELPGLPTAPGGTARVRPVPGGLLAVVAGPESRVGEVWLVPRRGGSRRLGQAGEAFPAVGGGYLAVTHGEGRSGLERWAADGAVRWRRELPWGATWVVRDTPHGMLQLYDPRPGTGDSTAALALVDPRTGVVRRSLGTAATLLASDDRAVAWTAGPCRRACPLLVTDLGTGRTRRYAAPPGAPWAYGSFSPDRRALLLAALGEQTPAGPGRPGFAAVLDLADGRVVRLPGVQTPAGRGPDAAWLDDATVVLGVHFSDHERLALWRRGARELTLLPARLDGRAGELTVLPPS